MGHSTNDDESNAVNGGDDGPRFQVSVRIRESGIRRWQIVSILRSVLEHSEALPGCLSCHLYENLADTGSILLLETWDSREAANRHLEAEAFAEIRESSEPEIEISEIRLIG